MKKFFIFLTNLILIFSIAAAAISTSATLEITPQKEKDAELLYNKINEFVETYKNCSPESFDDECRNYIKDRCQKPTLLDKNEFEKKAINKLVLYRGVGTHAFADSFKKGEIYIGESICNQRGNGIYTTNNINLAKSYALGVDDNIIKMTFHNDAKILENDYLEDLKKIIKNNHPEEFPNTNPISKKVFTYDFLSEFWNKFNQKFNDNDTIGSIKKPLNDFINEQFKIYDNKPYDKYIYFYESKKVAMLNNSGILAKLLGYNIIHSHYSGEVDSINGVYTQEYLILDSGILTICK